MPDVAVHAAFGRDVFSSLSPEIRQVIRPQPWTFGLFGPDLWFMYKPWRRREGRGRQMHTTRPGAFLTGLLERCAASPRREELFSWLAGFFCHYALDSITHPYIIYVTTEEYHYPRCHMSFEHELDMRYWLGVSAKRFLKLSINVAAREKPRASATSAMERSGRSVSNLAA